MRKQTPNVMDSLLATACDVLAKIAEILPKHDAIIKGLEPKLDRFADKLGESQREHCQRVDQTLADGFQRMEDRLESFFAERERLLEVLCRTHRDGVLLIHSSNLKKDDPQFIEALQKMMASLATALERSGVELISYPDGQRFDPTKMEVQGREDEALGDNAVIKALTPGYRVKSGESSHCILKAIVTTGEAPKKVR